MKIFKKLIESVGILFVSIFIFLETVNIMQFPTLESPKVTIGLGEKIDNKYKKIQDMEQESIEETLQNRFNLPQEENQNHNSDSFNIFDSIKDRYVFFDYVLNNNNIVIPILYIAILMTYLLQIFLYILSRSYGSLSNYFFKERLDSVFFYSSDLALSSPTIIGVTGTVYAFGMSVSSVGDISSLSTVFKENFSNAALTTIIGGLVYCLNLVINIFIAKNLVIEEQRR